MDGAFGTKWSSDSLSLLNSASEEIIVNMHRHHTCQVVFIAVARIVKFKNIITFINIVAYQSWANSVLMTEYEYYSAFQNWPNTNTNIIRASKNDRIRIRILFGSPKTTKYEYEYYSAFQKWPNTNTNIIWLSKTDRIQTRILFDFLKMTEHK